MYQKYRINHEHTSLNIETMLIGVQEKMKDTETTETGFQPSLRYRRNYGAEMPKQASPWCNTSEQLSFCITKLLTAVEKLSKA